MNFSSLRNRYATISIIVGALILLAAITANFVLTDTRDEVALNIDQRHQQLNRSRLIRTAIWELREALNQLLIDTSQRHKMAIIRASVQKAIWQTREFFTVEETRHPRQRAHMSKLLTLLELLSDRTEHLATSLDTHTRQNSQDLVHHEINPVLEQIWYLLIHFDADLEASSDQDVRKLSSLAQNQSYTIWTIACVGLILVVIGFFSLDRYVLSPMSILAQALFDEAHGKPQVTLPKVNSMETRHLVAAFTEMRNQIHQRQEALEHQALHDALTGLANRVLLHESINHTIIKSKRGSRSAALIIIDLDHFKEVNDLLGHQAGDRLLIEVSTGLKQVLRESDLVARLGGDEFAILLENTGTEEATNVCHKILDAFRNAFVIQEQQLLVGASLGVAVYPEHGTDPDTLIKRADMAMYMAKRNKSGFSFYKPSEQSNQNHYLSLANELRTAILEEQLSLHYQLKYDLEYYEAIGVEALIRWVHPEKGRIDPHSIINIAEQTGLITRLTLWVLDTALRQCAHWRNEGIYLSVAVNLSVYDLQSPELIENILKLLKKYAIPPSYLIIEVTENAMFVDPARAIEKLKRLDSLGIRIAVDDFGTGFSSLRYLKQLPVDELKIDKSFVMEMTDIENDAIIVRSTIELAHNLGLSVIAEGVEDQMTLEILRNLGCDIAQGFYMCQPVAAEQLANFMQIRMQLQASTG